MRYHSDEKRQALFRLIANIGDVKKTHAQTGVPIRTLHDWKDKLKTTDNVVRLHYSARTIIVMERYMRVRDKVVWQMERLIDLMAEAPPRALPEYALAVSRLIDRLDTMQNTIANMGQYSIAVESAEELERLQRHKLEDPAQRLRTPGEDEDDR